MKVEFVCKKIASCNFAAKKYSRYFDWTAFFALKLQFFRLDDLSSIFMISKYWPRTWSYKKYQHKLPLDFATPNCFYQELPYKVFGIAKSNRNLCWIFLLDRFQVDLFGLVGKWVSILSNRLSFSIWLLRLLDRSFARPFSDSQSSRDSNELQPSST